MKPPAYSLDDLLQVMARLRDPDNGCPWDLQQSFKTIVPSTLEECYELAHAIETEDFGHVAEELGDVLFQVVFYAQMGAEQQLFNFAEVVNTLVEKLIRRHPHIFSSAFLSTQAEPLEQRVDTVEEVRLRWEEIKQKERDARALGGIFDDVALALPALPRAQKIQKRAAGVNFDWPDHRGAIAKIREELAELEAAIAAKQNEQIEEEMGDLLFSCVNVSRRLGVDAEASLRRATQKFESRFQAMSTQADLQGLKLAQMSASELDVLWSEAKRGGSSRR